MSNTDDDTKPKLQDLFGLFKDNPIDTRAGWESNKKNTETITWIDATQDKPDSDITVLVATPSPGEPVWPGYFDSNENEWMTTDGLPFAYNVTHWAEMPSGPKP